MSKCDDARQELPDRRIGRRVELQYMAGLDEKRFTAEFNFYGDGRLCEVFARPFKTGADLEALLDKFCIALSHLLQLGMDVRTLWEKLGDSAPEKHRDIFSALIAGGVAAEDAIKAELAEAAKAGTA